MACCDAGSHIIRLEVDTCSWEQTAPHTQHHESQDLLFFLPIPIYIITHPTGWNSPCKMAVSCVDFLFGLALKVHIHTTAHTPIIWEKREYFQFRHKWSHFYTLIAAICFRRLVSLRRFVNPTYTLYMRPPSWRYTWKAPMCWRIGSTKCFGAKVGCFYFTFSANMKGTAWRLLVNGTPYMWSRNQNNGVVCVYMFGSSSWDPAVNAMSVCLAAVMNSRDTQVITGP